MAKEEESILYCSWLEYYSKVLKKKKATPLIDHNKHPQLPSSSLCFPGNEAIDWDPILNNITSFLGIFFKTEEEPV